MNIKITRDDKGLILRLVPECKAEVCQLREVDYEREGVRFSEDVDQMADARMAYGSCGYINHLDLRLVTIKKADKTTIEAYHGETIFD